MDLSRCRCTFCAEPSTPQGEHVLPKWLLRRWRDDLFTVDLSDEPILKGEAPRAAAFPRYQLPVCRSCNDTLNRDYEVPAKDAIRAVLDRDQTLESAEVVDALARWCLKTILLLQHPKTLSTFDGLDRPGRHSWDLPEQTYGDLLNRKLPSSDLSLWLAIADDERGNARLPELLRIHLPTIFDSDGRLGEPRTLLTGIRRLDGTVLLAQIVRHPLCDFTHPFQAAGLAARVWPEPPDRLATSALAALDADGRQQLGALFVDASWGEHLPGPGWRVELEAKPDGSPLRPPRLVAPSNASWTSADGP